MRYPSDRKAKTRQSILDAAGRVFKRRGYHAGGVDAVMKEAGLTHGGFYAHFASKQALLAEAIIGSMLEARESHRRWTEGRRGASWLRAFLDGYLSPRHRAHAEQGCPVPALVSELDRVGGDAKTSFEQGLVGWADDLSRHLEGVPEDEREALALGVIAACVGGVAVARAVEDEALGARVMQSVRRLVLDGVGVGSGAEDPSPDAGAKP